MLRFDVEVQQMNTKLSIELNPHQKGCNILQQLFNKWNFTQETRKSVQSILKIENVEVDFNKTIDALEINNYSQVKVLLSKKITIECDHEHLGSIKYNTDVFDSVNLFKFHLINNFIKTNSCEIIIINQENGNQFCDESWGQQGVFSNFKVAVQIIKQQQIIYNQVIKEMTIDVFQPVANLIHQFKNEQQIEEELITFKYQQIYINPDEVYINLNLTSEQPWEAEIRQDFIFKIALEQQEIKEITVPQNMEVFELIRMSRLLFKIENTIPLRLEYKIKKYILDMSNTVKQECIPIYSQLNLIKEASDNKINILLLNKETLYKQLERVVENTTLAELDILINHDKNTKSISYYVEEQMKDRKLNLKQLDMKSECIIMYQIVNKQQEDQIEENQQVLVQELHYPSEEISQIKITFNNKYTLKSLQITISSNCAIRDGLQEVLKTEVIKDTGYYQVYFGDKKLDLTSRFDQFNIITNSKLIYYTEFVIFQAFVQGQSQEIIVDQNLTISDIEKKFKQEHNLNQELSFQLMKSQHKKESLKQFLIKNKNYNFIFIVQNTSQIQVNQIELCIFLYECNSQTQLQMNQDETGLDICKVIKERFGLPRNQVLKLYIGESLVDQNETIIEIKDRIVQSKQQMRVQFVYFLTLLFVSQCIVEKKIVQAQLEDTLEQTLINNSIYGDNFKVIEQPLDVKQKVKDLPIENNSTIKYQSHQVMIHLQNGQTGQQHKVLALKDHSFENIINKLGVRVNKLLYQNQVLDLNTQIRNLNLIPNENIIFEEQVLYHEPSDVIIQNPQQIQVTVIKGDKKLIYYVNSDTKVGFIKHDALLNMQQGTGIYALRYQGNLINDQQLISSFGKGKIEFQFEKLVSNQS